MVNVFPKIMVPTDFSENSEKALEYAVHLSENCGSSIVLLHVIQTLASYPLFVSGIVTEADLRREMEKEAEDRLKAMAQDKGSEKVKIETRLRFGDPQEEILVGAREEQASLIVMGTHGRTGLSRVLIGNVAERVVRRAAFPVLTVPMSPGVPLPKKPAGRKIRAPRIPKIPKLAKLRIRRKKPSA